MDATLHQSKAEDGPQDKFGFPPGRTCCLVISSLPAFVEVKVKLLSLTRLWVLILDENGRIIINGSIYKCINIVAVVELVTL